MAFSLDFLSLPLLAFSLLVFASLVVGAITAKAGLPLLLIFMAFGMFAGEDGPGGIRFNDFVASFWVGNIALAVILLDGGLRTPVATFRTGLKPASVLATLGVAVSCGLTALAAHFLLDLSWPFALLIGAIVASTDAAAVFSLLQNLGIKLNERVEATLEIESGLNDPMAIFLTLIMIGIILQPGSLQDSWHVIGLSLLQQAGVGLMVALVCGIALCELLKRLPSGGLRNGGINALLLISSGLTVFALSTYWGGSGFLTIYVFGVLVGNRAKTFVKTSIGAMNGLAWLFQAAMFLLLGLLASPGEVLDLALPALGLSLFLMLVSRPISVWLCLWPYRFNPKEIAFISWVGLRGAVPIVLAIFPIMAGIEESRTLLNVAFMVVVTSLLFQGSSLATVAKKMGMALPDLTRLDARHAGFGDFVINADAKLSDLTGFYGLALAGDPQQSLDSWIHAELKHPPIVGDTIQTETCALTILSMRDDEILKVGLTLGNKKTS
nr:K(+)/H(+) antiporter NhaP2 [Cupriavidus sp.]